MKEDIQQIYLDADDDIVGIISKIESAGDSGIALVPPNRSTVLQSVVNLKLLRKAAKEADKKLVIITKDPNVLNAASQLKILIAANLDDEPQVPEAKGSNQSLPSSVIDGSQISDSDFDVADSATSKLDDGEEGKKSKNKKSKRFKAGKDKSVPDFDRFKKIIILSVLGIILLGLGVWGLLGLLPSADVHIDGRTQNVSTDFDMNLDTEVDESDIEESVLAAQVREISRTLTTDFEATGEKTVGEKATGEISLVNCYTNPSETIPAGTNITGPEGLVYVTNQTVEVPFSSYSQGECEHDSTATVNVTADQIGPDYNKGSQTQFYTISGYNSSQLYGIGSAMSGGSEEEVPVVSASDIEDAKEELLEGERDNAREELESLFDEGLYIVDSSFIEDVKEVESNPEEGEEADEARLIIQVTYSLLAVDEEDLLDLIEYQYIAKTDDDSGLVAIDHGLESVNITTTSEDNQFRVRASGILGPDLDLETLQETLAGMAYVEAIEYIESRANVTRAQIDISPFWASSLPKNPEKINIDFNIDGLDEDEDIEEEDSEEDGES